MKLNEKEDCTFVPCMFHRRGIGDATITKHEKSRQEHLTSSMRLVVALKKAIGRESKVPKTRTLQDKTIGETEFEEGSVYFLGAAFLVVAFFAAGFLAAGFLAAGFLAAGFLAAGFFVGVFFGLAVLGFFAGLFGLDAVFFGLAVLGFFAAAGFLVVAFFAAGFFVSPVGLAAGRKEPEAPVPDLREIAPEVAMRARARLMCLRLAALSSTARLFAKMCF